jgi:hypothetical protein
MQSFGRIRRASLEGRQHQRDAKRCCLQHLAKPGRQPDVVSSTTSEVCSVFGSAGDRQAAPHAIPAGERMVNPVLQ